jgi:hypothetical protein
MMLACMAGPIDTGQQIMTYLFIQFLPIIIPYCATLLTLPRAWQRQSTRRLLGASGGNLMLFDVKESRNTRNLLESFKTKPKAKGFELT